MMKRCATRLGSLVIGLMALVIFVPQVAPAASAAVGDVTEFAIPPGTCPNGPFGQCIPIGISHGPDGNLWIAANGGSEILKMNTSGVVVAAYSAGITPGSGPFHIHPGPDGRMWFTEINGGPGIGRITTSGTVKEIQTPTPNSGPLDIETGGNGQMFFTENFAGNVGRLNTTAPFNPIETPAPVPDAGPGDIVLGAGGFMWFTETNTDAVDFIGYGRAIGLCGDVICRNPVAAGSRPEGLVLGPDGNMWFTEHDAGKIGKMSPNGQVLQEFPIPSGAGSQPGTIIRGPSGDNNLYFTEEGSSAIGRINPTTGVIREFTQGITAGATPANLTVGSDNNIWFSEPNIDHIGRLSLH